MLLSGQRRRRADRPKCSAVPRCPWKGLLGLESRRTGEAHLDGEDLPKHDIHCSKAGGLDEIRTRDGQEREMTLAFSYFCRALGVSSLLWTSRKTLMVTLMRVSVRDSGEGTIPTLTFCPEIALPAVHTPGAKEARPSRQTPEKMSA